MSPTVTPARAIRTYVEYLNLVLNTILTDSRLKPIQYGSHYIIDRYQSGRFLPLELSPRGFLHFRQFVHTVNAHIEVESYEYTHSLSADRDDEQAWVCRYHYDREPTNSERPHAHMHINAEGSANWPITRSLRRTHFPTQRMSIEQLIWHVVDEGGAITRLPREEVLTRLAVSYKGFVMRRTDFQLAKFP